MKNIVFILVALGLLAVNGWASDDPVKDFLQAPAPYERDPGFYSTDKVYRLDLDLQGNGQIETLVTLNRDRDGQQGNIWSVYKKASAGYKCIGTMTFSRDRFYVGKIDELNAYGLVTFGTAGAHSGSLSAYIDNADSIRQVALTGVDSVENLSKEGKPYKKYLEDKGVSGDDLAKVIGSNELTSKYGVRIEAESYEDALRSGFKGISSK